MPSTLLDDRDCWGSNPQKCTFRLTVRAAFKAGCPLSATDCSPNFRGIESYEDHNVDVLYFWDASDKLVATAINVSCPAQEIGSTSSIHADFWDAQAVNAAKSELVAQPGTVTFRAAVALRPVTSLVGFRWIIEWHHHTRPVALIARCCSASSSNCKMTTGRGLTSRW